MPPKHAVIHKLFPAMFKACRTCVVPCVFVSSEQSKHEFFFFLWYLGQLPVVLGPQEARDAHCVTHQSVWQPELFQGALYPVSCTLPSLFAVVPDRRKVCLGDVRVGLSHCTLEDRAEVNQSRVEMDHSARNARVKLCIGERILGD